MREPGYYWVRFKIIILFTEDDKEEIGDWTVAFWDGQHWDEYGTDSETYIINETRILNPDEVTKVDPSKVIRKPPIFIRENESKEQSQK